MNQYKKLVQNMHLDDETKAKWAEDLANAAANAGTPSLHVVAAPKKPRFTLRVMIAAALAATLGLGGIAFATGGFVSVPEFVEEVFLGAPASTDVVDKVGRPLNCASVSNGVTVSADAVLGDAQNIAVVFSVSRPGGFAYETSESGVLPFGWASSKERIAGLSGMGGSSYFYDADPEDDSIQFVLELHGYSDVAGGELFGKTMRVSFHDLGYFDAQKGTLETVVEGRWDLAFKLAFEDASVRAQAGQAFVQNGLDATLEGLTVSPIAMNVDYTVDAQSVGNYYDNGGGGTADARTGRPILSWSAQDGVVELVEYDTDGEQTVSTFALDDVVTDQDLLDLGTIVLTFADGTTLEFRDDCGGSVEQVGDATRVQKGIFLPQVVDTGELVTVRFCGLSVAVG